jgi:hypothetical protein
LWIWIIFGVFLWGYGVKGYWLWSLMDNDVFLASFNPEFLRFQRADFTSAAEWTAVALTTFCLVATCCTLIGFRAQRRGEHTSRDQSAARVTAVAVVFLLLGLFAVAIQAALGFGVMGQDPTMLPYRMGTMVIRMRMDVAPAVLLFCLWYFEGKRAPFGQALALTGILAFAVADAVLRLSRGALVFFMLPVIFLWLITGRLQGTRRTVLAVLVAATIVFYPFISLMRALQISLGEGFLVAAQELPDVLATIEWRTLWRRPFQPAGRRHVTARRPAAACGDAGQRPGLDALLHTTDCGSANAE